MSLFSTEADMEEQEFLLKAYSSCSDGHEERDLKVR